MTQNQKIQEIFNVIATNNEYFIKEATVKLGKYKRISGTDPNELVSDVIFSVVEKLDTSTGIDKFYTMSQKNMLHRYLLKSIDTNCRFYRAPYLYKKIKQRNRHIYNDATLMERPDQEEFEPTNNKKKIIFIYDKIKDPNEAKEILGENWKYYRTILIEYISDKNASYRSIAEKYSLPVGSIMKDFKDIKEKLREKIQDYEEPIE